MASDSQRAAMDGLIRRSLAQKAGAAENCLGPATLAAYYERSLDAQEMASCDAHVSQCAACRELLALMARAEEEPRPAAGARHGWLWDWRWLATAAAAMLVLTVWGVRRTETTRMGSRPANEPLVAMSHPEQAPETRAAAPSAQEAGKAPAREAAPQARLAAPEPVRPPALKAPAAAQTEPPEIQQQLQAPQANGAAEPPVNGRNFTELRELAPLKKSADQKTEQASPEPGAASDQAASVTASNGASARAYAPAAAASGAASASNEPLVAGADAANANKLSAGNAGEQAKQAARMRAVAPALGGAVAQIARQRAGSTIIPTPDPKVMWRIVGKNFVERTENRGASWQGQEPAGDVQLTAGSAPSAKVCWLVGRSGEILVTKDAKHWRTVPPPVPADFAAVQAKSASSAMVITAEGMKFATTNDGKKWVPAKR
jgi:hypothetical protein